MRNAVSVLALLLLTGSALADAVTYKGTIGDLPIVAEITEPGDGVVAGRYFYRNIGGDIPLDAATSDANSFTLSEEALCQPGLCVPRSGDDYTVTSPPIAATWSLTLSENGERLTGTWIAAGKSRGLPIALERVGARELPMDDAISPYVMHESAAMAASSPSQDFSAAAFPYDFLKMDVTLQEGPLQTLQGSSFRYVIDPRTKFAFPRVVALADGSDPTRMNQTLALEHARMNIAALDCLSTGYGGFGWSDDRSPAPVNSLGDYDLEEVRVTYLSPIVMSWNEAGSLYCVAPHPDNHSNSFNYDVRTGQPLDLTKVLSGWVIRGFGDPDVVPTASEIAADPRSYHGIADASLIDWVRSHAIGTAPPASETSDPDQEEFEDECGLDSMIGEFLAVRFEAGDKILFTLEGLPYVIFACGQDVLTVPLADVPELLAPTARNYFPSLAK
jgi:hypothetical protein